jgi:hypothetical protein
MTLFASTSFADDTADQMQYYIDLSSGRAQVADQTVINTLSFGGPLNNQSQAVHADGATFFSIGMGTKLPLTTKLSLRIGSEFDYLKGQYNNSFTSTDANDSSSVTAMGTNTYQNTSEALLLNTQLFFQPFKQVALSAYVGIKAGVVLNTASNFKSVTKADPTYTDVQLSFPDQNPQSSFAYGWETGFEYVAFKHLGIHAGFEQLNLGKITFTNGTWCPDTTDPVPVDQFNAGDLKVNLVNFGLTYLF